MERDTNAAEPTLAERLAKVDVCTLAAQELRDKLLIIDAAFGFDRVLGSTDFAAMLRCGNGGSN